MQSPQPCILVYRVCGAKDLREQLRIGSYLQRLHRGPQLLKKIVEVTFVDHVLLIFLAPPSHLDDPVTSGLPKDLALVLSQLRSVDLYSLWSRKVQRGHGTSPAI